MGMISGLVEIKPPRLESKEFTINNAKKQPELQGMSSERRKALFFRKIE
jgi:hypothetical protein